ncbi:hypothetical protein B0H14DRAFT_3156910 [Mycena olivaceomarginata]|nr:hypothetical protein B0H14DRAFT_3156910 [Mycena olivaceomarginata]
MKKQQRKNGCIPEVWRFFTVPLLRTSAQDGILRRGGAVPERVSHRKRTQQQSGRRAGIHKPKAWATSPQARERPPTKVRAQTHGRRAKRKETILTDFLARPPNRVRFRWARDFLLARATGPIHDTNVLGNHWHLIAGEGVGWAGACVGGHNKGLAYVFDAWLVWKTLRREDWRRKPRTWQGRAGDRRRRTRDDPPLQQHPSLSAVDLHGLTSILRMACLAPPLIEFQQGDRRRPPDILQPAILELPAASISETNLALVHTCWIAFKEYSGSYLQYWRAVGGASGGATIAIQKGATRVGKAEEACDAWQVGSYEELGCSKNENTEKYHSGKRKVVAETGTEPQR